VSDNKEIIRRRRFLQWILAPIVLVTIGLGWWYPILGFTVPVVMVMGLVGGTIRGRYVCGNLCPRGGFFDRMVSPFSPRKPIPRIFRNRVVRWGVLVLLMGVMVFRIFQNPSSWAHWGRVFWVMCVVTTAVGVILGLFVHYRSWCAFCPMGTLQSALGGLKKPLQISAERCIECRRCEKVCPMTLPIVSHKATGVVNERDCLRCSECVAVCPKQALFWPGASAGSAE